MKVCLAGFVLLCGVTAGVAKVEPVLPSWDGVDRAELEEAGWIPGGLLLTDDPPPAGEPEADVEAAAAPALDLARPTAEDLAEDDVPGDEIPEVFWPVYFGQRPESFLVDPQSLLSPVDGRDRLAFLQYHSGDSEIDLFVYVFRGNQEIPGEVREEEMMERFFASGRAAAVVHYYLGAPQRSALYLSPSLTDRVSAAEQRRALESSIIQAFEKVDPARQFEAFLVQMSIRLYWIERMIAGPQGSGQGVLQEVAEESARPERSVAGHGVSLDGRLAVLWAERRRHLAWAAAVLAGFLVAVLVWFGIRRRARYEFPDFGVEPRLGGAHAAGVGAVISFGTAASPATQRDQVPDYLWRA